MSGEMDAAIDSALASATSGSAAPATESVPASAAGSPAAAPAVGSGSEPTPPESEQPADARVAPEDAEESIDRATQFTREQHERILKNGRQKEAKLVRETLAKEYGLSPAELAPFRPHIEFIRQHGIAAYHQELSRQLAGPSTAPAPPEPDRPQRPKPDLVAEDGTAAYSAPALDKYLEWQRQELLTEWQKTLAPLQQTHKELQEQQARQDAWDEAGVEVDQARKGWIGFTEHEPAILAEIQKDGRSTLLSAYNRVLQRVIAPALQAKTRQTTITDLQTRPDPNTVVPGATPRAPAKKGRLSIDDQIDRALETALARG